MKTKLLFTATMLSIASIIFSQGTWTQKAILGGNGIYSRQLAPGFSIGSKGYIGTGRSFGTTNLKDFWQWDQATDTWTQMADFGGTARYGAVGFSIGTKGYVGTGNSGKIDFWEWNQSGNAWTKKADFPGLAVNGVGVGFAIGNKGYVGTGESASGFYIQEFWQYDPSSDAWTKKADFPGAGRAGATGFSIGTKGYIGVGYSLTSPNYMKDFWEYNQATDTWTKKADYLGVGSNGAVGFSIGTKGYIGTGEVSNTIGYSSDFWQWDQATDTWTQKTGMTTTRRNATAFAIGNKGYIGAGYTSAGTGGPTCDFWEYYENTTSVNEEKDVDILIFPNPVTDKIKIGNVLNPIIKVHDLYGNLILSAVGNEIDMKGIASGTYFLQIDCNKIIIRRKIVKL